MSHLDPYFDDTFLELSMQVNECCVMADEELPGNVSLEVLSVPMVLSSGPDLVRLSEIAAVLYDIRIRLDDTKDLLNVSTARALNYWEISAAMAASNYQAGVEKCITMTGDRLQATIDALAKYGAIIQATRHQIRKLTRTLCDALHEKAHVNVGVVSIGGTTYQEICDSFFRSTWEILCDADTALHDEVLPALGVDLERLES